MQYSPQPARASSDSPSYHKPKLIATFTIAQKQTMECTLVWKIWRDQQCPVSISVLVLNAQIAIDGAPDTMHVWYLHRASIDQ